MGAGRHLEYNLSADMKRSLNKLDQGFRKKPEVWDDAVVWRVLPTSCRESLIPACMISYLSKGTSLFKAYASGCRANETTTMSQHAATHTPLTDLRG